MAYDVDQHGLSPEAFVVRDLHGNAVQTKPRAPAVFLSDPKYPHNLGQTVRAASCFGIDQVWWGGERLMRELKGMSRLPREERMRGYSEVAVLHANEKMLDRLPPGVTPVAIELLPGSESLPLFTHPEKPIYIFGPEDGMLSKSFRSRCHCFVSIPTRHCANLSAAVYLVLYDRLLKATLNQY